MPYSPKKPCRYPGCPLLTHDTYCQQHAKIVSSHYNRYERPKQINRRYHKAWPKIRKHYLQLHPFCEMCQSQKHLTKATEVHHVLPLEHGGSSDFRNLMALCKPCHSRITAQMDDRWHHQPHQYHY